MEETEEAAEELAATVTAQDALNEGTTFIQGAIEYLATFVQENWLNVVFALAIFIIGKWVAKVVTAGVKKAMTKKEVDPALISFLGSMLYFALMAMVIIASIQKIGIQTTSFVAILGAAGLAVGLALQGSLSNFAAGTLIILFKPFKIGDFVDAGGVVGFVEDIGVLVTILRTPDNKKIIAPNSAIMGGVITNFSANDTRRVDMTFGIGYGDDIDKAKALILEEINKFDEILKDPEPTVEVVELGDSSVNFCVRPWVNKADYWTVFFGLNRNIKLRFDAEGVSIPFPQRDVHLIKDGE